MNKSEPIVSDINYKNMTVDNIQYKFRIITSPKNMKYDELVLKNARARPYISLGWADDGSGCVNLGSDNNESCWCGHWYWVLDL